MRYTVVYYTCVCVCVCVCVCRVLQLLNDMKCKQEFLLASSHDLNLWICKIMLHSRVMAIGLLTWNAIVAFSECVAKFVHGVLHLSGGSRKQERGVPNYQVRSARS